MNFGREVRVSSRRRTEKPRNEFGVRSVPALLKAVVDAERPCDFGSFALFFCFLIKTNS